ncbi:DUF2844 domain-containing protein [Paraburkholderia sp.]|uniref:DUF2844 domain-containing protein n=1 Tax=Paraburkholderia sp. TaxID=1926495 RepID=UPI00286F0380|nr:DUF2844 domain-containing protein [Paraburkholderia sp.]
MATLVCAAGLLGIAQPASAALGGAPMTTPAGATVGAPSTANTAVSTVKRQAVQASAAASSGVSASTSTSASTSASSTAYTVRETTLANGTVVREYLSSAGTVFGVAWNGPQPPDLASLLGSYFPQYVAGVKANRAAGVRGPGAVDSSGLVVHSGGHMGAFSGEAWLPQALPSGVSASDIQ